MGVYIFLWGIIPLSSHPPKINTDCVCGLWMWDRYHIVSFVNQTITLVSTLGIETVD